jgi:DNA-binding FrmR family transcriptional regulator
VTPPKAARREIAHERSECLSGNVRAKGVIGMKNITTHEEQLVFLKKIEGQVRGIQRMIEEKRYCVDILTQIQSILGALSRVENEVLKKHIEGCVVQALRGRSELEKQRKINEVIELMAKIRKPV